MVTKIHKVMIDPGHGGRDPGNVNAGVYEKDSALTICSKIAQWCGIYSYNPTLGDAQIKALVTRDTDRYVDIDYRAKMARNQGCELMLSVHTNSSINLLAAGAEAYVSARNVEPNHSRSVAIGAMILAGLANAGLKNRGVLLDSKSRAGSLGVLRETVTAMPGVLVELGYASSLHDRRIICSPDGKVAMAKAIARAVVCHFGLDPDAGERAYTAATKTA